MNGKVLSGPAAVLIIVLFFLPWITVSCDGAPVGEFSGYHLATGTAPGESGDPFAGGEIDGDPLLFIVPLAGVVTLILLLITLAKSSFEPNASWGQIIASLMGILILALKWLQLRGESEGVFEVLIEPALWGTLIGLAAIAIGAVFDLARPRRKQVARARQRKEKHPYRPTIIASRQDIMAAQAGDDNYTILDDELVGAEDYASATILDDELIGGEEYGSYTILGDEMDEEPIAHPAAPFGSPVTDVADELGWDIPAETPSPWQGDPPQAQGVEPPQLTFDKTEVLRIESDLLGWLVIGSGERKGEQFRLFTDTSIGRDLSNDIVIDDTALSGQHARIKVENGRFFIFDQNSTNGVFVFDTAQNRWERKDAYELQDGAQIKIGRTVLHLMTLKLNQ